MIINIKKFSLIKLLNNGLLSVFRNVIVVAFQSIFHSEIYQNNIILF
jgi:hypothetical protein